jgi:aspartate oxidase
MRNGHIATINIPKIDDINDLSLLREIAHTAKRVVIATENTQAVVNTIYEEVYSAQRDIAVSRLQNLLQGML